MSDGTADTLHSLARFGSLCDKLAELSDSLQNRLDQSTADCFALD